MPTTVRLKSSFWRGSRVAVVDVPGRRCRRGHLNAHAAVRVRPPIRERSPSRAPAARCSPITFGPGAHLQRDSIERVDVRAGDRGLAHDRPRAPGRSAPERRPDDLAQRCACIARRSRALGDRPCPRTSANCEAPAGLWRRQVDRRPLAHVGERRRILRDDASGGNVVAIDVARLHRACSCTGAKGRGRLRASIDSAGRASAPDAARRSRRRARLPSLADAAPGSGCWRMTTPSGSGRWARAQR